jgi:ABC-type lipoprotein release transport system permease subunit
MSTYVRLAIAGLARAPGRTLTRAAVLAASVALLGGMLLFVGNSLRTVSGSAVRSVPLDLQGPVSSYPKAQSVAAGIARQPGVLQSSATATAPLAQATHKGPAGTTSAGNGGILAVPPNYLDHIKTFRYLQGGLKPGGIVLDQQMAATLQAHLGDTISVATRAGAKPVQLTVTGVALVSSADQLFQPLNPSTGPAVVPAPAPSRG